MVQRAIAIIYTVFVLMLVGSVAVAKGDPRSDMLLFAAMWFLALSAFLFYVATRAGSPDSDEIDARRYRWMRAQFCGVQALDRYTELHFAFPRIPGAGVHLNAEGLDKAIDDAIASKVRG